MELKSYQHKVIKDLESFLEYLQIHKRIDDSFNKYWEDKNKGCLML
jgi:type III restriction enzyme